MLKPSAFLKTPMGKIVAGISATLILIGGILLANSYYGKFLGDNILRSVEVELDSPSADTYSVKLRSADNRNGVYTQEAVAVYTFENKLAAQALAEVLKAGKYSFESDTETTNPAFTRADFAALIVKSANLSIDTSNSPHFSDVNNTDWFFPYIETLVNKGVIEASGEFQPFAAIEKDTLLAWIEKAQSSVATEETNITRAELSAMLVEKANLAIDTANSPHFTDVAASDWFFPYIETLANNEIVSGNENLFKPTDAINRAEVAKLLVETFDYTLTHNSKPYFKDVKPNTWYFDYVQTLAKEGVFDSSAENFYPSDLTKSADLFEWIRKVEAR
ncbi:MAG: S-layer homology domain-containing protein [Candidatus Gracilibacteria bacterium]|nr:S-layer homology domain-containing protein [Candidatus Gracilibacteria bacterium]MDD5179586.1 S-layer homology domain-containing protein [Candidatus Gracilibacteria bacterium]